MLKLILMIILLLPGLLTARRGRRHSDDFIDRHVQQEIAEHFPDQPIENLTFEIFPDDTRIVEIRPDARAEDYARAFQILREADPGASIFAVVKGQSMDHIVDVENMGAGGLLVFVTQHNNRQRRHVVKAEDIERFGQRKATQLAPPVSFPSNW